MFYQECKINNILKCQLCSTNFDKSEFRPYALPCGNTICSNCISLIEDNNNNKSKEFTCNLCIKNHVIPTEGFPINKVLVDLITEKPCEIYRSEMVEILKSNLKFFEENLKHIDLDMKNGPDRIHDHCVELRRLVQLSTEEKILELNQINELLISQIDDYEKMTISKYDKNKVDLTQIEQFKLSLKMFINETKEYLKGFTICDKQVQDANIIAEIHKHNLDREIKKLNFLLFDNNIMNFEVVFE